MNGKAIAFGIVLLLVGVGAGYYFSANYKVTPQVSAPIVTPTEAVTTTPVVNAVTSTPIPTQVTTVDESAVLTSAVHDGLIAEHGPDAGSMNITVSKIQGNFAEGMAGGTGGGGMWFAAKVNGTWKLAWDGNGTISCAQINPYNFPNTLVPECWDDATQKTVTR